MVRVFSKFLMVLALAGFSVPSVVETADAGKRYKGSGKHHGSKMRSSRRGHRHNGFVLRIPGAYLNGGYGIRYSEPKSYRGGPKIINVEKTLRERYKRELMN